LLLGHSALLPALGALVWWDQHHHRLPDWLTLPSLGMSGLWVALLATSTGEHIAHAAAVALLGTVIGLWLLAEAPGQPLGFGDVKLGAVLALHLGVYDPQFVVLWLALACVIGGVQAIWGLVTRRLGPDDHIAFGPALIISWMSTLVLAQTVPPPAT